MLFRLDYINHNFYGLDTHGIILVEGYRDKKRGSRSPP